MAAKNTFGQRLKSAFGNATNGVISSKLGVTENTVGFYVRGRVPDAEMLIKIANVTHRSIDWLLTGKEDVKPEKPEVPSILNVEVFEELVRKIVRSELANQKENVVISPLRSTDIMLAPVIATVGDDESEADIRKTG